MVQAVGSAIRARGCCNCQSSLLRILSSVSDLQYFTAYQLSKAPRQPSQKQIRSLSSFPRHLSISNGAAADIGARVSEKEHGEIASRTEYSETSPVPWYLQTDSISQPSRPISALQQIPDLPESSPPILEPLLQKVSVDLGIDNLSLLDLRHIDPPPALGANLLMIIGTARSEKHLHVSADRLCRWLRSEYKLRPDADGLLGRNELKLKLKRKNRRAKLLGNGTSRDEDDDGVRTGWVCVNVGAINSGSALEEAQTHQEGFVGFGRQSEGVRVVVQLLVEEKRNELDLERLWSGFTKNGSLDGSELMEETTSLADWQSNTVPEIVMASHVKAHSSTTAQSSKAFASIHSRGFHTISRKISASLDQAQFTRSASTPTSLTYNQLNNIDPVSIRRQILVLLESKNLDGSFSLLKAHSALLMAILQDDEWRKSALNQLRSYIESIPREQALQNLGSGYEDRNSTPFLYCFYRMITRFPSEWEWEYILWLQFFARRLRHIDYSLKGLSEIFSKLRSSGITISNDMYLGLLRTTLQPYDYSQVDQLQQIDHERLQFAIKILWDMYDRTGNMLTEDVFVILQEHLAYRRGRLPIPLESLQVAPNAAVETYNLPIHERQYEFDINNRITKLMSILQVPITDDINRIRLMTVYSKEYHWVFFWELWRSMARYGESRSPALWALMFKLVAETKHQHGCMTVLRTWIPEMDREDPQVKLEGEVLESVKACLMIADPIDDRERLYNSEVRGEWIALWRRCLAIT